MYRKTLILFLSLLTMVAGSVTAAPPSTITISSVPFTITAPGTYVLAGDLILPASAPAGSAAITIPSTVAGAVTLDFKGHRLTGPGGDYRGIFIGSFNAVPPNTYPITIRNGSVINFAFGVQTFIGSPNGEQLTAITINSIAFSVTSIGVNFANVNSSAVNNCSFTSASSTVRVNGIQDSATGGNSYSNNTFSHLVAGILSVDSSNPAVNPNGLILDRAQFSPVVK